MRHSENVAAVSKALVAAIGAMDGVRKDAQNSAFKANGKASTYATLAAVIEASRGVLSENKLCVIQGPGAVDTEAKTLTITTRIIHESGEWIETDFDMPLTKWSPHEAGSATTYGRRFALMAMLGLAPVEDDDGNAAAGVKAEKMPNVSVQPEGPDWYKCEGPGMAAAQAKKQGLGEVFDGWLSEIALLATVEDWRKWGQEQDEKIRPLPRGWRIHLRDDFEARGRELGAL